MEEFINRIIDIDKRARKMALNSELLKAEADKEIEDKCRQIKKKVSESTERRVADYQQTEQRAADRRLAEKKKQYADILSRFDGVLDSHKREWVAQLVAKTIE